MVVFLLPQLTEVDNYDEVNKNNYYSVNGRGLPNSYTMVANAIQDINDYPQYDYLILFTDADHLTVEERKAEANKMIQEELTNQPYKKLPDHCKIEIIVQNVCIETWFLGNRNFFVRHPQNNDLLRDFIQYFDVSQNNPEDLAGELIQDKENSKDIFGYKTKALFHQAYLREIFKERKLSYNKGRPKEVQEPFYLQELQSRIKKDPEYLLSFQEFIKSVETQWNK